MSEPVRIALIGAGYWGSKILVNLRALGVLAGYVDDQVVHEGVPSLSLGEVMNNPEINAVVIATPSDTHADLIRLSLLHGKHVCAEKPLCLSARESDELIALAAQKELILMVGYLMMFHPATARFASWIEGPLAECRSVLIQRQDWVRPRRHESVWWDLCVHDISMLWSIFADVPRHSTAAVHRMDGFGGDSLCYKGILTHPRGHDVQVVLSASWLQPIKSTTWTLCTPERLFSFRGDQEFEVRETEVSSGALVNVWALGRDFPLLNECAHFIDSIQRRSPPRSAAARTREVMGWLDSLEAFCRQ